MSFMPFTNDVVVVAPVTSVNTTSVNIASVTPVRNRFRSGYAIDMRRTGARLRNRPNVHVTPATSRSALYMIVQLAPITIMRPERMKIEKSSERSPNSQSLIGSTNHTTRPRPAAVRATRSGTPRRSVTGTRPSSASETPNPSVMAFLALTPDAIRRAPRMSTIAPITQDRRRPRSAGGSGRLRIAVTMFMRLTRHAEAPTTTKVSSTPRA